MEALWIAVLGVVQGATEFLPVSSSGHLAAAELLLERRGIELSLNECPLLLEVLLHLATALAVIAVYRREVVAAIAGLGRAAVAVTRRKLGETLAGDDDANLALALVVGSIPTALLGLALRDPAAVVAASSRGLGFTFLGSALLLLASRWWPGGSRRLDLRAALLIGSIQGVAVLPGISRSGVTIATALALGLGREEAARFSFLLSLPAILGAALLELDAAQLASAQRAASFGLGALAAFVTGLIALLVLLRAVRRGKLWLFAPYVAGVGIVSLALLG